MRLSLEWRGPLRAGALPPADRDLLAALLGDADLVAELVADGA